MGVDLVCCRYQLVGANHLRSGFDSSLVSSSQVMGMVESAARNCVAPDFYVVFSSATCNCKLSNFKNMVAYLIKNVTLGSRCVLGFYINNVLIRVPYNDIGHLCPRKDGLYSAERRTCREQQSS